MSLWPSSKLGSYFAIKVLTSVWWGKLFVFTACLVWVRWLKADFPFNRFPHHEREDHMLWCHIVCLIPIKCSISMQSWQRLTVCAIAILSMGSLSLTHSDIKKKDLTPNMSSKHFQIKSVFTGIVHPQWKFRYYLLNLRQSKISLNVRWSTSSFQATIHKIKHWT